MSDGGVTFTEPVARVLLNMARQEMAVGSVEFEEPKVQGADFLPSPSGNAIQFAMFAGDTIGGLGLDNGTSGSVGYGSGSSAIVVPSGYRVRGYTVANYMIRRASGLDGFDSKFWSAWSDDLSTPICYCQGPLNGKWFETPNTVVAMPLSVTIRFYAANGTGSSRQMSYTLDYGTLSGVTIERMSHYSVYQLVPP